VYIFKAEGYFMKCRLLEHCMRDFARFVSYQKSVKSVLK